MSQWLKRVVLGLVGLAALTASVLAILATTTKLPGEEKTPAGVRRDTALYIKMRDGVQIAADVLSRLLGPWPLLRRESRF